MAIVGALCAPTALRAQPASGVVRSAGRAPARVRSAERDAVGTGSGAHAGTKDARLSVHADNEPVRSVLMRLARDAGANITIGQAVAGYVTVSVRNVTLRQAVDAIVAPLGDVVNLRGGIYDIEPGTASPAGAGAATSHVVLPVAVVTAKRAAAQLRGLFPQASIREDDRANALVVVASPADAAEMRTVLQGLDVKNPTQPTTEALTLKTLRAEGVAARLHASFPATRVVVAGPRQLLVTAAPQDLAQVKAAVTALDAPTATPPPVAASSEAIRVSQRAPRDVARALAAQVPGVRASVAGSTIVLGGPPDAVARAKALVAQIDVPLFGERYTQVYRIRSLDAASVADLLRRSFHDVDVTVDASLNALAVTATTALQQRITDALAQLDPPPGSPSATQGGGSAAGGSTDIVTLKSYVPGQTQGGPDAVAAMTQAVQVVAPDVRVVQLPTPGQIALVGPPASVRTARSFIDKVDVVPALVVLDTEVLEVDESTAKNLGLQLGTAAISSTFTEMQPQPNADGTTARIGRFQAFTRTPIQFTAQLNLLIQSGKGRVLADPRITTLSGRTATIRAGDTISILTTTAGNAGTIATTQVQSFQTGVTLDITPAVSPDGGVTVALHPVVNSLIGTNNGVPEISTRDTQTTVHLQDDETLVIGGLIQENDTRTTTRLPVLGDLPLVGRAFRNDSVNASRNELIIVVTPHIIKPGTPGTMPGPAVKTIPTAAPLPTLPPNAQLPPPGGQLPGTIRSNTTTGHTPRPATRPQPSPSTEPTASVPTANAPTRAASLLPASGSPAGDSPSPAPSTPAAAPAAFAQTNVFTFGSPPQSNFAKPTDPVQIFYATLSPTVVANGTSVHVAAVTTTNVNAVKLQAGSQTIVLAQSGSGKWQAGFPFSSAAVPAGQTSTVLTLVASRADGSSASVPITVNLSSP